MRRVLPILLLLLAGAVALWLWPATDRLPAQGAPAGASAAVDDAAARPASALAVDLPERPNEASYTPPPANPALVALERTLPPISTPLAQAREAWWSAARQGSGEAAWRLVVASATCEQYQTVRKLVLRDPGDPVKPERVAMEEFLVLAQPYCASVDGDQQAALREALQLGVRAGDVRALASYLLNPPLPRQLGIRLADELVRYRSQAPAIAQWLFNQGYANMPAILAHAHDGRSASELSIAPRPVSSKVSSNDFASPPPQRIQTALGQVLPDDPALAWRYARLCVKVGGDYDRRQCRLIEAANESALDDAQKAALQAWVDVQAKRDFSRWLPTGMGGSLGVYSL
jgi:hypothetical protein